MLGGVEHFGKVHLCGLGAAEGVCSGKGCAGFVRAHCGQCVLKAVAGHDLLLDRQRLDMIHGNYRDQAKTRGNVFLFGFWHSYGLVGDFDVQGRGDQFPDARKFTVPDGPVHRLP